MILSGWFLAKHVQACTRQSPFAERSKKSSLVDQRASGHIDQTGRRFHQSQPAVINDVTRLLVEVQMQRHKITLRQYTVEISRLAGEFYAELPTFLWRDIADIDGRDFHAKRLCSPGQLTSTGSKPNQPQGA